MKHSVKFLSATLAAAMLLGSVNAMACTGLYVGKDASAEGTTIIARSEDISPSDYTKLHYVVDHVDNVPGRFLEDINGFKLPLPATTYQYTTMSDYSTAGDGVYAAVCTNEYGVAVTGTVSASGCAAWKAAYPKVKGGLREAVLPAAVAAYAKTAKEGVDNLLAILDEYGSGDTGNVIMVADQTDAWIVEIYGGHHYCAMKMPADQVAVFGNQFMIGCVDQSDADTYIFSDGLFDAIEALGLTVTENGLVNLAKSICGSERSDNSNMRTWIGHHEFAPSTAGDYVTEEFYPLFYAPDEKVGLADVMAMYRNRYQGTQYDANAEGNEGVRPIAVSTTPETHVVQIYGDLPAAHSAVTWLAMGGAEHSVFLPEFSGITDVHPGFKVDTEDYDPTSTYWSFKKICGLADVDRNLYTQGVEDFWTFQESVMMAQMADAAQTVKELYAADPAKAAAYATELAQNMAGAAMEQSDKLYAGLLTTVTHNAGLSASKKPTAFVADTALRQAAEAKGYAVAWTARGITLTGAHTFVLTPGSDSCQMDGQELKLSKAPYLDGYTTYVPMDFIENL